MGGSNSPGKAIAVDGAGEAYITGTTASNDLPTTPGSFEPVYPGGMCTSCYNGYVEKLNSTGSALVYSTYFGAVPPIGSPSTIGSGIAVDASGSAYIVGNTTAIPTQNPIQASYVTGIFPAKCIRNKVLAGRQFARILYLSRWHVPFLLQLCRRLRDLSGGRLFR
jgi:hypothetical protein